MKKEILILVPTEFEFDKLLPHLKLFDGDEVKAGVSICGFGPVAAAARTATLIARNQPTHLLMTGIAGSLSDSIDVGEAVTFSSVDIDDIGAGSGSEFQSADQMGWGMWESERSNLELRGAGDQVQSLLTVCAASGSTEHADMRRRRFPHAVAEDMETYAAAFAAFEAGVPFTAIRGISNIAGQRDKSLWQVDAALAAAAAKVNQWVEENFG